MNDDERGRDTLDDPVDARNVAVKVPRSSRGYQLGAFAVLAAAIGLVAASAVPAVARELGVTEVRVVRRDFAKSSSAGQVGMDAVRDFEKGIGRSVAELELDDEDNLPEAAANAHAEGRAKMAVAARDIVLREDPKRSSPVVGSAKRGQSLVLLREEQGWYMVVQQTDDGGLEVGWVPEREVVTSR